jgi:hypothetical protein
MGLGHFAAVWRNVGLWQKLPSKLDSVQGKALFL